MKVRFNRYAQERAFRAPKDFARYADAQQAKFDGVKELGPNHHEWWGNALATNWRNAAAAARGEATNFQTIQRSLTAQPVFPFESRLVAVLEQLTSLGLSRAAQSIVPFLTGQQDGQGGNSLHVMTFDAHAQFITALALENTVRRGAEHASIEQAVRSHEDRLASMLEADAVEIDDSRTAFREMLEQAQAHHEHLAEKASAVIAAASSQWQETHNAFVEQLATETAVKLWSDRSTTHATRYKSFRTWTIGFGLSGLVLTIAWIFAGFAFARWMFPADKTAQLASYTAGSIALFTLFVWGLRVLIRSMMSEDHLSTDASARSALAHTYLALTKEEAATPEDRAIILATLFAPVSDGLVKDDGMPALSPTALLAQQLTR